MIWSPPLTLKVHGGGKRRRSRANKSQVYKGGLFILHVEKKILRLPEQDPPPPPSLLPPPPSRPSSRPGSRRAPSRRSRREVFAVVRKMDAVRGRAPGVLVAVAHGAVSASLNIMLKFLMSSLHFRFLTLLQLATYAAAALGLETLRRFGRVSVPAFSLSLSKEFAPVCILSTLQSTLTLWSLRGLSLPMYVVFKRCLPLFTLAVGVCVLRNGAPSPGVIAAVVITTGGAALAGAGDLSGDPFGYVTGVLAVVVHASYLVVIQKTSLESQHGPLTAQYAVAVTATPVLLLCALISSDAVVMWSYSAWSDARVLALFLSSVTFGCAKNFTTYHCTYLNSAVTTSFVGVVKSVITITVGIVAFDDVAPTALFLAGVVVNTVGSIIYCGVKFFEIEKKPSYDHLEGSTKDNPAAAPPGEPYLQVQEAGDEREANGVSSCAMKESDAVEMHEEDAALSGKAAGNYVGVWRSIRQVHFPKDDALIHNMELQSP
ncbi:solute carrier family 35 member D3 [Syngnathoides biaculeatus]|uniref:solute carrier family 35 member D3 n=1 Tax=Syngnathoides biaculeatus TaxID=300417 RepID=UPI002ADE44E3|nr:solute carrier family 35 member D3 [Syngnathoides biaculeatus]